MKTTISSGIALLLLATIGAFASAQKSATLIDVFYIDSHDECVPVKVLTACSISTTPLCSEQLFDAVTSAPLGFSDQIWGSRNTETAACEQPYRQ